MNGWVNDKVTQSCPVQFICIHSEGQSFQGRKRLEQAAICVQKRGAMLVSMCSCIDSITSIRELIRGWILGWEEIKCAGQCQIATWDWSWCIQDFNLPAYISINADLISLELWQIRNIYAWAGLLFNGNECMQVWTGEKSGIKFCGWIRFKAFE